MSALAESQPGLAPPHPRESDVTLLLTHDPLCLPGDLSAPGVRAVQPGWVSKGLSMSRCAHVCPWRPVGNRDPVSLCAVGLCRLRGGHKARVVALAAHLPPSRVRERTGTKVQIPPLLLGGCMAWGGCSTSLCCVLLRMYIVGAQR